MKLIVKFVLLSILIMGSFQSIWAAPRLSPQRCEQSARMMDGHLPALRVFQTIDIPEGLLPILLILIPVCGGALLIGVLVIVLLLRRSKKNPSVAPPPPTMVAPPSMVSTSPVEPSPQVFSRCPNCGENVSARAKFCNRCGTPLVSPQPSQPPYSSAYSIPRVAAPAPQMQPVGQPYGPVSAPNAAYASSSEPVIGIIGGLGQQKGLSARAYNLIVTQQRLVFARLTDQMLKAATEQSKQEAKAEGRGFFGQWGAMFKANAKVCERYYQMPIDMILQETPDNFVVYPQQVRRVRILIANSMDQTNTIDRLVIHATSKMTFLLKGTNARETKQILRQVLGNIVK
jgi:hypothetical protein